VIVRFVYIGELVLIVISTVYALKQAQFEFNSVSALINSVVRHATSSSSSDDDDSDD
jgi:hypothetical protein